MIRLPVPVCINTITLYIAAMLFNVIFINSFNYDIANEPVIKICILSITLGSIIYESVIHNHQNLCVFVNKK